MQRKASGKSSTKRGKVSRKLSDLAPKRVKDGDAASIKGGFADGSVRFGKIT